MLSRLDCCWRPKRRQIIRITAQQNLSESTQKIIILNVTGSPKKKEKAQMEDQVPEQTENAVD